MNSTELNKKLLQATKSPDFADEAEGVIETLKEEGASIESVEAILRFMEAHPTVDFGTPGPLAHFLETFYGHGYETELLASITRRPTAHTAWLLNRVINGTKQPGERARLIGTLREANSNPAIDPQTKRLTAHFLERLSP